MVWNKHWKKHYSVLQECGTFAFRKYNFYLLDVDLTQEKRITAWLVVCKFDGPAYTVAFVEGAIVGRTRGTGWLLVGGGVSLVEEDGLLGLGSGSSELSSISWSS